MGTAIEKDLLISQGAHEIRNPVSVILGYVRMLERLGPLTESQQKAVGEVVKSTAKLAGIADEMSLLSRLMAGSVKLQRARIDLAPLIAAEISSLDPLPDRHVGIRMIGDAMTATVNADATRLREALNSLIYSHRRELVTSDELCVAIDRAGTDESTIRVTMGGADRIDALRRLPASEMGPLVEFRSGLGYRLSIARQVIEAHGGRIFSKTEPGASAQSSPIIIGAAIFLPDQSR